MKTTLDIKDELLIRAKKFAKRAGKPLRAVVEDGLRLAMSQSHESRTYDLPEFSVGDPNANDPLESLTWQDLRDEIYGGPDTG
ncbi:MAG: hypothetical protein O7E57_06810 [Gammaproteobacteria bacterium]|nr:hypothetical protein [Gammaproteobacteria bacterium]